MLLGGPVGPRLKDLLDSRISVPKTVLENEDQYHIILEYRDGDEWGSTVSKCSNRFILTRDIPNGKMTSIEFFFGKTNLPSTINALLDWYTYSVDPTIQISIPIPL